MGRLEGKVAFISGIARGQGRAHAVKMAEEGADIVGFDICHDVETVGYPMATAADLEETVKQVEALDRRIIVEQLDARDLAGVTALAGRAVADLGRLDIVVPNAGIVSYNSLCEHTPEQFQAILDINLVGVWHVVRATVPHVVAGGRGGSVIFISSAAGIKGFANVGAYSVAKHGVIGMMRVLAKEMAPHNIRSNAICPTNVRTGMIENDQTTKLFMPDDPEPTLDKAYAAFEQMNMLPVGWIESIDISNVVAFLASDEARYITSIVMPVDAGCVEKLGAG